MRSRYLLTVMTEQRASTLRQLLRRPVFTGGALVLFLGCANWVVGNAKLAQYEAVAAPTSAPSDGSVILSSGFTFSDVSESHERSNIAAAKVKYYSVVLIAGGDSITSFGEDAEGELYLVTFGEAIYRLDRAQ